jgi:hypothetical protein
MDWIGKIDHLVWVISVCVVAISILVIDCRIQFADSSVLFARSYSNYSYLLYV